MNVNAVQASKSMMWQPTQQRDGEGRRRELIRGSKFSPSRVATGVLATACLPTENRRNTGDPRRWKARLPTGRPRGTGRAVWGVGQAHSTVEAG
jgi:hypothetical protein